MEPSKPSLALIEIPMYIGGALYLMIGVGLIAFCILFGFSEEMGMPIMLVAFGFSAILSFALGGFCVYVTTQLKHRKKWAWISSIVIGAMYCPSAFVFLGVPILIGCFRKDVNDWFNPPAQPTPVNYPPQMPSKPRESKDPYQPPRY